MLCFFCMKSGHLARNCPRKLHAKDTDENGDIIRLEVCWNCGGTGHNGGKCEEITGRPLNVRRTLTNRSLFRKARDEGLDFADIAMRAPGVEKGASGILGDAPIDDGMECDEATPTAAHAIKISLHDSTGITAEFDDALMTLLLTRADTAESPVVERSKDFVILRFNNEEDAQQATQRLHNTKTDDDDTIEVKRVHENDTADKNKTLPLKKRPVNSLNSSMRPPAPLLPSRDSKRLDNVEERVTNLESLTSNINNSVNELRGEFNESKTAQAHMQSGINELLKHWGLSTPQAPPATPPAEINNAGAEEVDKGTQHPTKWANIRVQNKTNTYQVQVDMSSVRTIEGEKVYTVQDTAGHQTSVPESCIFDSQDDAGDAAKRDKRFRTDPTQAQAMTG